MLYARTCTTVRLFLKEYKCGNRDSTVSVELLIVWPEIAEETDIGSIYSA
jgi:hypothetical protein